MGLLDSVIGALGQQQPGSPAQGGQGELIGAVVGMLAQNGGLGALLEQFQRGGLGDVAKSWVGTGQNLPVSPDQLGGVLGNDTIGNLARQFGVNPDTMLGQLSQMLPQLVDHLTPHGQVPEGDIQGMPGMGDLAGMLGGLLNKR